ncbi:MarR family winged helix-turn-helix transcriptional regulator [Nocardia sp. CC227C]|uniref:MarR family winged helix-turn-helix transcriptional regulator n=1 Tax=Nocardia sp. CC227C TaxID=3044562 RepID=UPI00278C1FFE|nr:MarR family transcriptional regulator [Nocardia sp. CC227C]
MRLPTELERSAHALRLLHASIDDTTEQALQRSHGISVTEYLALAALEYSDDGGHLRQQVLAESIPLQHSSVSRLVSRLDRAGLTERYLCESDRRGVYTQITDRGRELVRTARQTYLQALRTALSDARNDSRFAAWVAQLEGNS